VRLGSPLTQTWDSPDGWVATLQERAFRAAYWPLGDDADPGTVRAYADAVEPQRTFYSLEPMPWTLPDSADSYLELMEAIDRPRFAVHFDSTNLINTPAKFYANGAFLRQCFAKLGPHIKCCHAKDITLANELTVHLAEAIPGRGSLDFRVLLEEMDRLDPDTPILVEHLTHDWEYAEAAAHIRGVAESLGLKT